MKTSAACAVSLHERSYQQSVAWNVDSLALGLFDKFENSLVCYVQYIRFVYFFNQLIFSLLSFLYMFIFSTSCGEW